jgi:hypothetical protein
MISRLVLAAVITLNATGALSSEYRGKVGELDAVFSLDWKDDGSVPGSYHYPKRPGVTYRLSGNNPAEGELYLEEFSDGTLTARCHLRKIISDSAISWKGKMENTDGRTFEMHFARGRSAPAKPAPAPAEEGTRYSGNVGRLAAEYDLTWHDDGSVTGSYSYPDRPGVTYRLEGSNPREGELYLVEYTGGKRTARCNLRKRLEQGEIVWEGEMLNTDGRRLPMALRRNRAAAPPAVFMSDYEKKRADLMKRIQAEVSWETFPRASTIVEMVPLSREGAEYFGGKVKGYRSGEDGLELTFVVGDWGDGDEVVYSGPEVTLRMARSLPIPEDAIVGKSIGIQFGPDGSLSDVELFGYAVSHFRKSTGGKLEVRGVLETEEMVDLHDVDDDRMRAIVARSPRVSFLPDKLALGTSPSEDVFFRSIRLTPEYGLVIQATAAGPGILELETLALDAPEPANPWISVGDPNTTIVVPSTQLTREAG